MFFHHRSLCLKNKHSVSIFTGLGYSDFIVSDDFTNTEPDRVHRTENYSGITHNLI